MNYQKVREEQAKAFGDSEAAWVKIAPNSEIVAAVGTSPQGQSHETVVSQIVADVLGVYPDDVYALARIMHSPG